MTLCLDRFWTHLADRRFADDNEAEMELLSTVNGNMTAQAAGSEFHEQSDRGLGNFILAFLNIALSAMRDTCNRICITHA